MRAAERKPTAGISAVQSGTMNTPPQVAPFMAMLTAMPRFLSNHGATIALIPAPLMPAHPTAMTPRPRHNCHGCAAEATASSPMARAPTAHIRTFRGPNRSNASPTNVIMVALST